MYDFQVDQIKENKFEGSLYLKFEESAILISKNCGDEEFEKIGDEKAYEWRFSYSLYDDIFEEKFDMVQIWRGDDKMYEFQHTNKKIISKIISLLQSRMVIKNFNDHFECYKQCRESIFLFARNKKTKSKVTVKKFQKSILNKDQRNWIALKDEVAIVRKLDHENIMKFNSIYESEDSFYLVFELVISTNLKDLLKKHSRISNKNIALIMQALFRATSYLHSRGIIHRDINPRNVFFRKNKLHIENIVLGDFGLSTRESEMSNSDIFSKCGTPGFIAPEIFSQKKKKYNKICDLFSIGITFYNMRFGKIPYKYNDLEELMTKNKKCDFEKNLEYNSMKSIEKYIFEKFCQTDPEERGIIEDWLSWDFDFYSDENTDTKNECEENDGHHLSEKIKKFHWMKDDCFLSKSLKNNVKESIFQDKKNARSLGNE